MRELSDRIRILAMHHYTDTSSSILTNPGINKALPFILLAQGLEEVAGKLAKSFKSPILEYVYLWNIAVTGSDFLLGSWT